MDNFTIEQLSDLACDYSFYEKFDQREEPHQQKAPQKIYVSADAKSQKVGADFD